MRIPRSFKVAGHTIRVKRVRSHRWAGSWYADNKLIELPCRTKGTPQSHIEQSFCHELVHCLFEHAGRDDLSEDEKLVDSFAHLLHQALTTAK